MSLRERVKTLEVCSTEARKVSVRVPQRSGMASGYTQVSAQELFDLLLDELKLEVVRSHSELCLKKR